MTADALTPAEMAALHAACFQTPRPWSESEITQLLADPLCFALSARQGFLIGRCVAGEAELLTIAVAPEARRNGQGRALLRRFLAMAASRAATSAFLEVREDNLAATRLYLAEGFTQAGRRRGYYALPDGGRVDACVLTRHITGAESAHF